MVYIRQKNLHGLKEYKYSGVDHSLLSRYVLKPFYNNVAITWFPMSMAYVVLDSSLRPEADQLILRQAQCREYRASMIVQDR